MWLLGQIIESFDSGKSGVGLPLGNLTSQLFSNVYLNPLDQLVKHFLHAHEYIRYVDDFVIFSTSRDRLEALLLIICSFLAERLHLELHPQKVEIRTVASGVDFLGWVHFSNHRVLRTSTKKRMLSSLNNEPTEATVGSYLGMLSHGNTWKLHQQITESFPR